MLPGTGPIEDRYAAWREAQAVPVELLEWVLAHDRPWRGLDRYLGGLSSQVEVNVDLPVLSSSLAHLVAEQCVPADLRAA